MSNLKEVRLVRREDREFERVVFAEVLVPETLNTFADWWSPEAIRQAAYAFAEKGYGLDVEHDNVDVTGSGYYVVESFIARAGDPDFIEGSWVVGVKIVDDDIWQQIINGELNGFSFEATVFYTDAEFTSPGIRTIIGVTEPDPFDGHTHTFTVVINEHNQVISGGTGMTDNHYHPITVHTVTGLGAGHNHRYQVVEEGRDDD